MEQKNPSGSGDQQKNQKIVAKLQNLRTRLTSDRQAQTDLDSVIQELNQQGGESKQA